MIPEELVTLAVRHQVHLERLKSGEAKKFHIMLNNASAKITRALGEIEVTVMSEMTQGGVRSILAEVKGIQSEVFQQAIEDHMKAMEDTSIYEAEFESKSIGAVAPQVEAALTVPKAQRLLSKALKKPLSATGQLLEPFINQWKQKEIAAVQNVIRKGYTDGWTIPQLVRAIKGTKKMRYKDGMVEVSRRNATAVARTSTQHIASASRFVTWAENADVIAGYKWVSTLDSRTSQTCKSLDGKVFKLGKGPTPPIHIGCRSTTVADIKREYKVPTGDSKRASSSGAVPADQTYYSWLKEQPAGFQDSALGKTRGKLFRDGGLSSERFAELNLNRTFEPMTLDEMKLLEPTAFERASIK